MDYYAYFVAGWLMLVGVFGIVRSHNLVHAVGSLSVCQAGTYVLLLAVGYQHGAVAPVYPNTAASKPKVVDPVIQAMTLTDIVVGATVTALLLALAVQISKRHSTVDPDELSVLHG